MKRKVGDKVIIKSLDWWKAQLKNEYGDVVKDEGFYSFTEDMSKFCGKEAVIEKVLINQFYHISINNGRLLSWNWEDWMFEDTDKNFDYYEFTPQNLRKLVWGGNGEVIDQNDKILNLYPTFVIGEALLKDNSIFSAVGPFKIRVPKEKEETSIYQFKSFDKVLVRNKCEEKWQCNFFSHHLSLKIGDKMENKYCCVYSEWKQCIPYEGNENLVGRTENPPYYGN
jgi:hypothetical protein